METIELKRHFDALESQRRDLDGTFSLIERFVVPFRGNFNGESNSENEVDWRKRDKYDDTAVMAAQTLASSMQGSLTSPATRWFNARFRSDELNEDDEAKEWLEECVNIIYQALQDSNFDLEASELYLDLTAFGTGIVVEEAIENDAGEFIELDFSAVPIQDCYFELDHKGRVAKMFRILDWTALQIVTKFGEKGVSKEMAEEAEEAKSVNTKHKIIFAIYNRPENKDADTSGILASKARPFGFKYFIHKDAELLGEEGGYYEMPSYVSRWRKVAGSKWGYSPAMVVMGDILTLNELTEGTLEALAKVVDPATLTTERGLLSDLDLGRGGLTVVRSVDDVKAYESKARFDVGELKIDRLQNSINRAFYVDQLQLKESPAMTATEVQVRYELMQRLLGPTLGRLQNDFLDPLIERTFSILLRGGKLPDMPEIVSSSESELDIDYVGPLARAQKMDEVTAVQQWIASLANLAEVFPGVLDIPEVDRIARGTGDLMGVPAKYMKDKKQVDEDREIKAKQQQMAQAVQMMQEGGKAAQEIGKGQEAMGDEIQQ